MQKRNNINAKIQISIKRRIEMLPQPIETAPRDGTVILTDCGFAKWLDQRQWGSPIDHYQWTECDPYGNIYRCADNNYLCHPRQWTPTPDWIRTHPDIHIVTIQTVDGKDIVRLPKTVSARDFADWMNNLPNKKHLQFDRLPEKWTSADDD